LPTLLKPLDQGTFRIAGLGSFVTFLDGLLKNQIFSIFESSSFFIKKSKMEKSINCINCFRNSRGETFPRIHCRAAGRKGCSGKNRTFSIRVCPNDRRQSKNVAELGTAPKTADRGRFGTSDHL